MYLMNAEAWKFDAKTTAEWRPPSRRDGYLKAGFGDWNLRILKIAIM
jgi:hypothetical protein